MPPDQDPTQLLNLASNGDPSASAKLLELVYCELRAIAAYHLSKERPDHTLQPTALVHEAYLKLVDQTRVQWSGTQHFLALAATMMRRILVDHARSHNALKRSVTRSEPAGPISAESDPDSKSPTPFDLLAGADRVDLEALDAALTDLEALDRRQAQIVELRFFGGHDVQSTAQILGVCERTVKSDWQCARGWLYQRLRPSLGD